MTAVNSSNKLQNYMTAHSNRASQNTGHRSDQKYKQSEEAVKTVAISVTNGQFRESTTNPQQPCSSLSGLKVQSKSPMASHSPRKDE